MKKLRMLIAVTVMVFTVFIWRFSTNQPLIFHQGGNSVQKASEETSHTSKTSFGDGGGKLPTMSHRKSDPPEIVDDTTAASQEHVRKEVERMAKEMPYVSISNVLFDRPSRAASIVRPEDAVVCQRILSDLKQPKFKKETLVPLLTHEEPKVRTLVAIALYQLEDPTVLPELMSLITDGSITFETPTDERSAVLRRGSSEPLSVQKIAISIVSFYMARARNRHFISYPLFESGEFIREYQKRFNEYWTLRKNRDYCAGWFAVKLARAGQGTSRIPEERTPNILRVRNQINQLPLDDRVWTLLWLQAYYGSEILVTKDELVDLCKEVGPDKLILLLQRNIPSSDPDLQPGNSEYWEYREMCYFILEHAQDLLRPRDISALRACERYERDYEANGILAPILTSQWTIARAKLMNPSQAVAELRNAYQQFQGKHDLEERTRISLALWASGGIEQLAFLNDWFYQEINNHAQTLRPLVQFVDSVLTYEKQPGLQLIKKIVVDNRFSNIIWKRELEPLEPKLRHWRGKLLGQNPR